MAHNEVLVSAPPDAVFAVLSDPCAYPDFVVGTKEIRRYDDVAGPRRDRRSTGRSACGACC